MDSEQKLIEISGIDLSLIKKYKVGFVFDQNYQTEGSDARRDSDDDDIGLVRPMVMKDNIDPYSGKKIKRKVKKSRKCC